MELLAESQDSIKIKLTSTNTSRTDTLLFYTPTEESFCVTVISIDLIEVGTNKEHSYFPCTEIADLDHILLNKTNSVLIPPSDSFSFDLSLDKKRISPHLKKGRYRMKASLYYGYGNFKLESATKYTVYRGTKASNDVSINVK